MLMLRCKVLIGRKVYSRFYFETKLFDSYVLTRFCLVTELLCVHEQL